MDSAGLDTAPVAEAVPGLVRHLSQLHETCDRAAALCGGYDDFHFRLAGLDVRLRFAGPALAPFLTPALAHVRSEAASTPALTVRVFDSDSTGVELPEAPWDDSVFRDGGRVHGSIDGVVHAVFEESRFSVHAPGSDSGLYWVRGPSEARYYTGSPLVPILHLCLASRGVQVVHAGAVGDGDGCVLVVGPAGAGKSSTVLACLGHDLDVLSDDYCLVGPEDPPVAHTLFSSARANEDTIARLPFLEQMVSNPRRLPGEKPLCMLADHVPERLLTRAPIKAIAIPRVAGRPETTVTPTGGGAALAALAPSTLRQLRGSGDAAMGRLARVVRSVPSYHLDAGTDPAGVADAIRRLVRG